MQQIEAFADLAGLAAHSPPIVDSAHFTLPIKRPTAKDLKSLDKTQPPRQPSTNLASSSSITLPSAQRFFSQLRAILQLGSENFMSKTTNPRSSYRSSGDSAHMAPPLKLVPPFPEDASLKLTEWEKNPLNSHPVASRIPGRPIVQHTLSRLSHFRQRRSNAKAPAPVIDPELSDESLYLREELAVRELNDIHIHLWWAGRPGNIHCLHDQKLLQREVVVTERTSLHLIWHDNTIYIKPLPAALLNHKFWTEYIAINEELQQLALGFLKSYTKLLQYPVDLRRAKDLELVPENLDWQTWHRIASSTLDFLTLDDITSAVNKRYHYGELRLGRLNHISIFCRGNVMRMYRRQYTTYDQFFSKNFAWMLLLVVYLSVVLTAMQVVLSVPDPHVLVIDSSYWFSIASIIVVAVGTLIQILVFIALFVAYFWETLVNLKRKGVHSLFTERRKTGISDKA